MQMPAETDTPVQSDVEDTEVVWSDGSGGSYLKRLNSSIAVLQEINDQASVSWQKNWQSHPALQKKRLTLSSTSLGHLVVKKSKGRRLEVLNPGLLLRKTSLANPNRRCRFLS